MLQNNELSKGQQAPTLGGLKRHYINLLLPLQERFWSHELTCAPAIEGNRYKEAKNNFRLMYVGRAVNGWETEWKKGSIDELVEQVLSSDFKMASIAENPNQNGYNYNRSGFFQLCKKIMEIKGEGENWSDKVLWSNLYKVSPFKENNPGNKLIKETIDQCIQILEYEIELYRPSHIVFVTDDWWFDPSDTYKVSFAEQLKICVEHKTDAVIIGKGTYKPNEYNIKVVVTKRPEGLKGVTREGHAELILEAFASLQ